MLAYAKQLMEYGGGAVAINPSHTKLITSLRTAVENGEGSLDKEATSHDDLFDAFRLSECFGNNEVSLVCCACRAIG